jgi:hypothetical protein
MSALPADIASSVGREGDGSLTVAGERGPVVVPVRWRAEDAALYTALPSATLGLADVAADAPAALTIDEPSVWRARDMVGAMFQGQASCFVVGALGSGATTAASIARSIHPSGDALVRLVPTRSVWWKGWTSGSGGA